MSVPAPAKRLLDFIAGYEAPRGYDTVYGNKMSQMPKPLTRMTVDEAIAQGSWRTKTFGSSACGRYQFMKATLSGLKASQRLTGNEVMTPDLQDRLGYALLLGRGYVKFMSGAMSLTAFGNEIAKEWASFPVLAATNGKRRGQSYYAGDGLNHVLVGPEPVERVLTAMRAAPVVAVAEPQMVEPDAPILAPRAPVAANPTVRIPWWQRLFGAHQPKAPAAKARPGLSPNGSPDLWDIQADLKARGYYSTGLLDGLDGGKTQAAVAQIRKDNGLGDGGIDAAFRAGLPTWPHAPVSTARKTMSIADVAQHAPEVIKPPAWLATAGAGLLGLGGVDVSGISQKVQAGVDTGTAVVGQVQTAFGLIGSIYEFAVAHQTMLKFALGGVLLWYGVNKVLNGIIKVRTALF